MNRWIRRLTPFFFVVALHAACQQPPYSENLDVVERKMTEVAGRIPLGDYASLSWDPLRKADWFVIVPAKAGAADFAKVPEFEQDQGRIPPALLGLDEPAMALVTDGEVRELKPLPMHFGAKQVFAKPGRVSHGLRFVREAGRFRSSTVLALD